MAKSAPRIDHTPESEPRGARRKRETHARLLAAALRLMAEKGMEGVAINEITEAADVGFGSFYNHFESKEAIYAAVVDWVFEDFADWLDRLVAGISDPAEIISISVRHTLLRAQSEPLWGQFLIREGLSMRATKRGLGQRLLRDIRQGIAARRFSDDDAFMSFLAVAGTVLASIAAASTDSHLTKHLPERSAAMVLQTLGLDHREANDIARRSLPR
jgi:AcrR family transcriptional regulator